MISNDPKIKQRLADIEAHWDRVKKTGLFKDQLDHGHAYPGGPSLGYDIVHPNFTKHPVYPTSVSALRSTFLLEDMEWCANNCKGSFYRMRDPTLTAQVIAENSEFDPKMYYNFLYDVPCSILTFENPDDALRFRLARV